MRQIAGCGDDLGREEFDKLWYWLYPVAFSLTHEKLKKIWECTSPKWIEGFITREEAENALKGPQGPQKPGTFVLRFPTSRSWPHPDAGSIVVAYVASDSSIRHRLLSLDLRCTLLSLKSVIFMLIQRFHAMILCTAFRNYFDLAVSSALLIISLLLVVMTGKSI